MTLAASIGARLSDAELLTSATVLPWIDHAVHERVRATQYLLCVAWRVFVGQTSPLFLLYTTDIVEHNRVLAAKARVPVITNKLHHKFIAATVW